jgi:ankyrin repeat protein
MYKLPYEIIDKILIKLNNALLAIELKRLYAAKKICMNGQYLISRYCEEKPNLEMIKILHSIGYEPCIFSLYVACTNGHLEIVKFLHSVGTSTECLRIDLASENGHLEVVKFLHSVGVKYTNNVMEKPIENGNYELVKYLQSIGAKYTDNHRYIDAAWKAEKNSHAEFVRWLHNQDHKDYHK